jgi:predicted GNAT superfamily acetyltransferase
VNVYGESSSLLHRGTPTDRLIAEWWIRSPHVEQRLAADPRQAPARHPCADAPVVNPAHASGPWVVCDEPNLSLETPQVWVEVPPDFSEMQSKALDQAQRWRSLTRQIFMTYFGRGYRATDFELHSRESGGRYLLSK